MVKERIEKTRLRDLRSNHRGKAIQLDLLKLFKLISLDKIRIKNLVEYKEDLLI